MKFDYVAWKWIGDDEEITPAENAGVISRGKTIREDTKKATLTNPASWSQSLWQTAGNAFRNTASGFFDGSTWNTNEANNEASAGYAAGNAFSSGIVGVWDTTKNYAVSSWRDVGKGAFLMKNAIAPSDDFLNSNYSNWASKTTREKASASVSLFYDWFAEYAKGVLKGTAAVTSATIAPLINLWLAAAEVPFRGINQGIGGVYGWAQTGIGESVNDWFNLNLDETGKNAIMDAMLGFVVGWAVAGVKKANSIKADRAAVKAKADFKADIISLDNSADVQRLAWEAPTPTPTALDTAITNWLNKVDEPIVPEKTSNAFVAEMVTKVEEKVGEEGRKITDYEVAAIVEEATGQKQSPQPNIDIDKVIDATNIESVDIDLVLNRIVWDKTQGKSIKDAAIKALAALGIDSNLAAWAISAKFRYNAQVLDELRNSAKVRSAEIIAWLRAMNTEAAYGDKSFKYSGEGLDKATDLNYLVRNWVLKEVTSDLPNHISFEYTNKAVEFSKDKNWISIIDEEAVSRSKLQGGSWHIPESVYSQVKDSSSFKEANGNKKPKQSPSEEYKLQVEKVLKKVTANPLDAGKMKARLESSNFDSTTIERASSARTLYNTIMKGVNDNFNFKSPWIVEAVKNMRDKLETNTNPISWDWLSIDLGLFSKFMKEVAIEEKFNFRKPLKTVNVKTTNGVPLFRGIWKNIENAAKQAFDQGVFEERRNLNKKIYTLTQRMDKLVGEAKAEGIKNLQAMEDRIKRIDSWKYELIDSINWLAKKKDVDSVVFYWTRKDSQAIWGKFLKRIMDVENLSQYKEVTKAIEASIEETNVNVLTERIRNSLKLFTRKRSLWSKNPQIVDVQFRLLLETLAKQTDKYFNSMDSGELKVALDWLANIFQLKRSDFIKAEKLKADAVQTIISESKTWEFVIQSAAKDNKLLWGAESLREGKHSTKSVFKKMLMGFVDPMSALYQMVNGDSNNPFYKVVLRMKDDVKMVDVKRQEFAKDMIKKLQTAKLLENDSQALIDRYGAMMQSDFHRNIYNDKGEFIGNDIFEDLDFATEADYMKFRAETISKVESNPVMVEAYNYARAMFDEYYVKLAAAELLNSGTILPRVDKYWRAVSSVDITKAKNMDEQGVHWAAWFDKSFMKERTRSRRIKSNYIETVNHFINKNVRRAETLGSYNQVKAMMDGGILNWLDEFSVRIMNQILEDTASPQYTPSNLLTQGSNLVSQNAIWLSATAVISQTLSLLDAPLYVKGESLRSAMRYAFDSDLMIKANKASRWLYTAEGFDFAQMEARMAGTKNKAIRTLQRINDFGLKPMSMMDLKTKQIVWMGAYADKFETKTWKKFDWKNGDFLDKDLVIRADDVMEKAIGSKDLSRVPPHLRSQLGRVAYMLQTFVVRRAVQMTWDLPREFQKDPVSGGKIIAAYGISSVLATMMSPMYNEIWENVFGVELGKYKTLGDKLAGMEDAEAEEVMFKLALNSALNNVPLASNFVSMSYGKQWLGVLGAIADAQAAYNSQFDKNTWDFKGTLESTTIATSKIANTLVGWNPFRKVIQAAETEAREEKTNPKRMVDKSSNKDVIKKDAVSK